DEDMYTVTINYEELVKIRRQFPFLKDADQFSIT
ncbi:MAG: nitrilase family protein, partial [Pedobacter sp.]